MDESKCPEPEIPHLWARFRIVTPLFLGGANQADAELRLSSIKGALRYWYRTVHPGFADPVELERKDRRRRSKISGTREEVLFGSANQKAGQSRVVMHLKKTEDWDHEEMTPEHPITALNHLAFSLIPEDDKKQKYNWRRRRFLKPDQVFTVYFSMRNRHREDPQDWPSLLASVWLLAHVGSLGTRGRQGFGSLTLEDWDIEHAKEARKLLRRLPLPDRAATPQEWKNRFRTGINVIRSWLERTGEPFPDGLHTTLDERSVVFLAPETIDTWLNALKLGNEILDQFHQSNPQHRIAFGLPAFVAGKKIVSVAETKIDRDRNEIPTKDGRMPSPVRFRVARTGGGYLPLFIVMSAPFPRLGHKWDNYRAPNFWEKYTKEDFEEGIRLFMQALEFKQFLREGLS